MARTGAQDFTQSWNKTVEWAHQNNIPYSAYYPVYQQDASKFMTNGYGMSEAERYHAIEASAGLNYSNVLPTDTPNPANVPGNIKSNASSIFTGITGIFTGQTEANIWDTVKQTVEHPSELAAPFMFHGVPLPFPVNVGAFSKIANDPHNIYNYVPGIWAASEAAQGVSGLKKLADNPLNTVLDVVPVGRVMSEVAARTEFGASVADKIGVSTEELKKLQPSQVGWRVLRKVQFPSGIAKSVMKFDAAGQPIGYASQTVGGLVDSMRLTLHISKDDADIVQNTLFSLEKGTKEVVDRVSEVLKATGDLSPQDYQTLSHVIYRTDSEVTKSKAEALNDPRVQADPKLYDAVEKLYNWSEQYKQIEMQAGRGAMIRTPLDEQYYSLRPGDSGPLLLDAKAQIDALQTAFDKASQPLNGLIYKIQLMDNAIAPQFETLGQMVQATYQTIKRSVPEATSESIANQLRTTLPTSDRWDRAVSQQTPLLKNLLGLTSGERLTLRQVNAVRDLFMPGGLLDQMQQAFNDQDWRKLDQTSKVAMKKFDSKALSKIPVHGRAVLMRVKTVTKSLHDYSVQREKDSNAAWRIFNGTKHGDVIKTKNVVKNSVYGIAQRLTQAHDNFLDVAIHHPPSMWRNKFLDLKTEITMAEVHTAKLVDEAGGAMKALGYGDTNVDHMLKDPQTVMQVMSASAKNDLENNAIPDIPYGLAQQITEDAYQQLASMRARGHEPGLYIPSISALELERGLKPTADIRLSNLRPKTTRASFDKMWDYTGSVNDIQLGVLYGTKEQVQIDVRNEVAFGNMQPFLHNTAQVIATVMKEIAPELGEMSLENIERGYRVHSLPGKIQTELDRLGFVDYKPDDIMGPGSTAPTLTGKYLIHKDHLAALEASVNKYSIPAQGLWDRGTRLFRFSILGLSPRYTAHIVFGGTFLLALRGHVSMFSQLRDARYLMYSGDISKVRQILSDDWANRRRAKMLAGKQRVLEKYPQGEQAMSFNATQEGMEDQRYHIVAGMQAGNWVIDSWLHNHGLDSTWANRAKAASQINMKFTRAVVRMQRAIVYLDGAARATKTGFFYDDDIVPKIGADGNEVVNPVTGRTEMVTKRVKKDMTPEQAHVEGMHAIADVMGELRRMTMTERNIFQRFFPFYGWTKHVINYVLTYPFDHPYRAMLLSQLSEQNSLDVASGLPLRIQLLFFLGHPDAYGNVSTVDVRAFNPLRDTANYASWQGLFQSLNPIVQAPWAMVDPQIIYGSNPLYPNATYNSLYGVDVSGPQGSIWTAAEQFVPQLTAADAAFNLSGQYAYLKQNDPSAFAKKVFESLNLPFYPSEINVRQMAAHDELDRFYQAAGDAKAAWQTGDFSTIDKYPKTAELPDPLNTQWNLTPDELESIYNETMSRYHLNPLGALPAPKNPAV
jgi:hypothetical protein